MSEENVRRAESGTEVKGSAYLPYMVMEDILEKLKLLNYELEFLSQYGHKPISRTYFAVTGSAGEQFFVFSHLLSWLLKICGRKFEAPMEDDDPNAVISNIISEIRALGLSTDFPPSRLKGGSGDEVCYILNQVTNKALEASRFTWRRPEHKEESSAEETVEDDMMEDEIHPEDDDIDEDYEDEVMLDVGEASSSLRTDVKEVQKQEELLESRTDALEWKMEVERVIPSLKVHLRAEKEGGAADWRTHLDKMLEYRKNVSNNLNSTKTQLDQMYNEIIKTLEKIGSREKYVNSHMEGNLTQFRHLQDKLTDVQEKYKSSSTTVNELSRELAIVTEELEGVKAQMDEKGTSMTDSGPLVKIKQALTRMKNELIQMELRIGVLQHVVLAARVSDKDAMQRDIHSDDYFQDVKTF